MTRTFACLLALVFSAGAAFAQPKKDGEKKPDAKTPEKTEDGKLPHTKLPPAKLVPNLCVLKYRVSTASPEAQAHFDQGLGYYYSYVWMEAARSFETAATIDPNCALAWWGLSKACEKWGKAPHAPPLKKAQELMAPRQRTRATPHQGPVAREGDARRRQIRGWPEGSAKTLDELLTLYDDDEEGWFAALAGCRRAQRFGAVLQGAAQDQSAASGGQSRADPPLREYP